MRSGAFACLGAAAVLAGAAPDAVAQRDDARPAVLLVLDASRSMRAPAGDGSGRSRMDAAKDAVDAVLDTVPAQAPMGLRTYGANVAGQGKAKACADTELVAPVRAGDRGALRDAVAALEGKGRTPIGNALLATPDDFGDDGRRHQVILVSDGLDNCAPPEPCAAARRVAKRGVELTISVVGFRLDAAARRQMRCIARVGGGTYVDANDTDRLREELLTAFARAFRGYEAGGTEAEGGEDTATAPRVGSGLYQGELRVGEPQTFAVELEPGQRLFAAGTLIVPEDLRSTGGFEVALLDAAGDEIEFDATGYGSRDTVGGRTITIAQRTGAAGIDDDVEPGPYGVRLTLESDAGGDEAIPFELAVEALDPDARPGLVREPGPEPEPSATPTPTPTPTPEAPTAADDDGGGPSVALVGACGIVVGLLGGLLTGRRRR
jgi:Ca-activated chloride channel family protein